MEVQGLGMWWITPAWYILLPVLVEFNLRPWVQIAEHHVAPWLVLLLNCFDYGLAELSN